MVKVDKPTWKANYFTKLMKYFGEYSKVMVVGVDNVGSRQMQVSSLGRNMACFAPLFTPPIFADAHAYALALIHTLTTLSSIARRWCKLLVVMIRTRFVRISMLISLSRLPSEPSCAYTASAFLARLHQPMQPITISYPC